MILLLRVMDDSRNLGHAWQFNMAKWMARLVHGCIDLGVMDELLVDLLLQELLLLKDLLLF